MHIIRNLYFARFAVLAAGFLFIFPIAVAFFEPLEQLFGGLFDLRNDVGTNWLKMAPAFFATTFAYLFSWSSMIIMRIAMLYGPERAGYSIEPGSRWLETEHASKSFFFIGLILPVPFLILSLTPEQVTLSTEFTAARTMMLLGALLGFLTALLVVFAVDFVQRLFNSFHNDSSDDSAKRMFFPWKNPVSEYAEKKNIAAYLFKNRLFDRGVKLLRRIDPRFGVGFIRRKNGTVLINPGQVLAAFMLLSYLGLYGVGVYFWVFPIENRGLPFDVGVTAITYLFVVLTLAAWLFSGIAFLFDRYRYVPIFLILLSIFYFVDLDHKYEIDRSAGRNYNLLASPQEIFKARAEQKFFIFIAAEGGGIQASAWTAEVLTRLVGNCPVKGPADENLCRDNIVLMSGASGGSVGIMHFKEAYNSEDRLQGADQNERIRKYARESSLDFVAGGMAFNDLLRNFPFASSLMTHDRGTHLGRGWLYNRDRIDCEYGKERVPELHCNSGDAYTIPHFNERDLIWTNVSEQEFRPMLSEWDIVTQGKSGQINSGNAKTRPAVAFGSTLVETGQRMVFSTYRMPIDDKKPADAEYLATIASGCSDISRTEAVRLSAAFPFVSPAASARDPENRKQQMHLVDGGYYDNYGMLSIRDFIREGLQAYEDKSPSKPAFIVIRIIGEGKNNEGEGAGLGKPKSNLSDSVEPSSLWQFAAPLTTLMNVRPTLQRLRDHEALQTIQNEAKEYGIDVYPFTFAYRSGETPIPLSWHLTERQIAQIDYAGKTAFGRNAFADFRTLTQNEARPYLVPTQFDNVFKWLQFRGCLELIAAGNTNGSRFVCSDQFVRNVMGTE